PQSSSTAAIQWPRWTYEHTFATVAFPGGEGAGMAAQASAYDEMHCNSNFSFLDGASHPEELVDEAARLGLAALAVTDRDGFYGVVRFAGAARAVGLPTIFGAELTLACALERRASAAGVSPAAASATGM